MSRDRDYYVYIVTNETNTVLYIGITSDLEGRLWEHQNGESGSKFTRRYHVNRLLFCEHFGDVNDAIAREKQLKGWTRAKKEALIRAVNPTYEDIAKDWNHGVSQTRVLVPCARDASDRASGGGRSFDCAQDDRAKKLDAP